jgi:hypothetical protein
MNNRGLFAQMIWRILKMSKFKMDVYKRDKSEGDASRQAKKVTLSPSVEVSRL